MNMYRPLKYAALLVALNVVSSPGYADTPPWWNDTDKKQSTDGSTAPPPKANTGAAANDASDGPVLEEYTITRKPAQTVDDRAREQAAATTKSSPAAPAEPDAAARYFVQPGDVLLVSVWHEPDLTREVRVSPDGWITYPLVGEVQAEGTTVESLRASLETKLHRYINEAVVNVSVKEADGNRIYVLGKVNRPGMYPFTKNIDVVQALTLAGGTSKFAATDNIKILRRIEGEQQTYKFRYSDVERGRDLEQNILLRSGDVVVVP
jgi:polysaccharide export outer membrane protein